MNTDGIMQWLQSDIGKILLALGALAIILKGASGANISKAVTIGVVMLIGVMFLAGGDAIIAAGASLAGVFFG